MSRPEELGPALDLAVGRVARNGGVVVEELVEGPEVTVNAFSVDGELVPLTVTDRSLADPPAFGVALAHVWPSEHDTAAAVEAARGRGGGARRAQRADVHAGAARRRTARA